MKKFNKNSITLGVLSTMFAISGCTTTAINEAETQVNKDEQVFAEKMKQARKMTRSATSVSVVNDMYVAGKSFRLSDRDTLPRVFNTKVVFNQLEPVSLQEMVGRLSTDLNTRIDLSSDAIDYLNGLDGEEEEGEEDSEVESVSASTDFAGKGLVGSNIKFSFEYNGTVAGLLDVITSKANLFWKWEQNHISVFRQETKHYIFDGDSSEEDFEATIASSRSAGEDSDGGSQDTTSSSHRTNVKRSSGNIYADLKKALSAMISGAGRYSVSTQQGIITVTDTPAVQTKVAEYIEQINHIVNRRIAIKTEVYEIASDDAGNFGIDWDVIYDGSSNFSMDFSAGVNAATGTPNIDFGIIDSGSHFNGSKSFVTALNSVANISLVTSTQTYTTNGKPVPVQVADERAYLKSMSIETDEQGNEKASLEPGTVLSGYSMSLTPRVNSDGDIDLQFAVDMSQLNEIETLSVNDSSMIQLPNRTFKNFLQRVSVDSGKTVMISGFERSEYKSNTESIAGKELWAAGGKRSGGNKKIKTMILITPYIMAK